MAYSTGTVNTRADFLSQLSSFASSEGWTIHVSSSTRLSISKGGCFINLGVRTFNRSVLSPGTNVDDDTVVYALSESYDSGTSEYYGHPGSLATSSGDTRDIGVISGFDSSVNYHFFSGGAGDPDYLYVVVEVQPGEYSHAFFGNMRKLGSWSGGQFALGIEYAWWFGTAAQDPMSTTHGYFLSTSEAAGSVIRVSDSQLSTDNVLRASATSTEPNFVPVLTVASRSEGYNAAVNVLGRNSIGGVTPLYLIPVIINTDSVTGVTEFRHIGSIPNLAQCSMEGRQAGDEVLYGGDTWKLFPYYSKGPLRVFSGDTDSLNTYNAEGPSSWNFGLAIKKVT